MMMSPGLRKFALSIHLTSSVGWIGAVVAYLALGVTAVRADGDLVVRSAWIGMEVIGWYVVVPLAVTSLATGVVMAIGTKWGLFRHYWVAISFALTVFATAVLILHMPTVSVTAEAAQAVEGPALRSLGGDLVHPALGLGVLLFVQFLNMYKPSGLTPYGWRRQQAARRPAGSGA